MILENAVENHFTAKTPRAQRTYNRDKIHPIGEDQEHTRFHSNPCFSFASLRLCGGNFIPTAFFRFGATRSLINAVNATKRDHWPRFVGCQKLRGEADSEHWGSLAVCFEFFRTLSNSFELLRKAQIDFLLNNGAFVLADFNFAFNDAKRSAVFGFGFGAVFKDFGDFKRKKFFVLVIVFD